MKNLTTLLVLIFMMGLLPAFAQDNKPPLVKPVDTKDHVQQTATVCGKVVGSKIAMNGVGGHGFPVNLYLDEPESSAVFYFTAFPGESESGETGDPKKVVAAYDGKRVCVTGKILKMASGPPFIIAADKAKIKTEPADK
jgi:hypothetical protein